MSIRLIRLSYAYAEVTNDLLSQFTIIDLSEEAILVNPWWTANNFPPDLRYVDRVRSDM